MWNFSLHDNHMEHWKHAILAQEREQDQRLIQQRRAFNAALRAGGWATHPRKCGGGSRTGMRCISPHHKRCLAWVHDAKKCPRKSPVKSRKPRKSPVKLRKPRKSPVKSPVSSWERSANTRPAWQAGLEGVLTQVHPGSTLHPSGSAALSGFLGHVAESILAATTAHGTGTQEEMQAACDSVLVGELIPHARAEVQKAFRDKNPMPFAWEDTREIAAAIGVDVSEEGARVLATTLEYLCAEVLELAGNAAAEDFQLLPKVIQAKHVDAILAQDPELGKLR